MIIVRSKGVDMIAQREVCMEKDILIACGERCWIHDFWRRFNFGTRDQAWSFKSFCVAEFFKIWKGTEKASDIDIGGVMESAPLASVSKGVIYFFN